MKKMIKKAVEKYFNQEEQFLSRDSDTWPEAGVTNYKSLATGIIRGKCQLVKIVLATSFLHLVED